MIQFVSHVLRLPAVFVRVGLLAGLGLSPALIAQAQNAGAPLAVTTWAGQTGTRLATNGTGAAARFSAPSGLAVDSAGNLYVADSSNNLFRRITSAGVVTTFAGTAADLEDRPINIGSADGAAANATFHFGEPGGGGPYGARDDSTIVGSYTVALDSAGTLYFADTLNNTIRKIAGGVVSTVAGAPGQQGTDDGTGGAARFLVPSGVAVDSAGNLYVTDTGNNTIRKITPAGVVSTFAGVARTVGSVDGTGTAARFNNPAGIAADSSGNLYVTDAGNHTIRKITPAGVVTTFAGLAGSAGASDGSGAFARFNGPTGITVDAQGNVYVADTGSHTIRRITPARAVSTIAGATGVSGAADGTGNAARFNDPYGIAVDAAGAVYVADTHNNTIRRGVPVTGAGAPSLNITSQPQRQLVVVGASATFRVAATGSPAPTYQWQKAGVNLSGATNATYTIPSTQFADAGLYSVVVTSGSISFTSTPAQLQVFPAGTQLPPIIILGQPTDQEVLVGQAVTFSVEVAGVNAPTYQWKKNDANIVGATSSTYTLASAQMGDAGLYTVTITDGANTATTSGAQLTVSSITATAPSITAQPAAQTTNAGGSVTFSVTAAGNPAPAYQWRRNGTPLANGGTANGSTIVGATTNTLTLTNAQSADAGAYSVTVSNTAGTATSNNANLTVNAAPAAPSRLVNLSILTPVSAAGDSFTLGYVVGGEGTSGPKPLVIRAAGPSLGALGVPGTLADPKLELFAGATKTGENDNWGGSSAIASAMAAVGAFPYASATSLDAAALANITTRDNSVKVSSTNNGTGTVIAEVYDATPTDSFTGATPRLVNVSVLKQFGTGFTIGFVIRGPTAKTVLVRAVGPGLAAVGVTSGFVPDPQLTLFGAGATQLGANNDWGGTATLSAAFTAVGAFALPAGSRDAALLATLNPGDYTVQVAGIGASGLGLVEVYDVP